MSFPRSDEDVHIVDDTLEKLLGVNSPYSVEMTPIPYTGNITFGESSDNVVRINNGLVTADNGKLEDDPLANNPNYDDDSRKLSLETISHETNHLVNGDEPAPTFGYLNEEYRAWYVGRLAASGEPPTNKEAIERWKWFLDPNGGYWDEAEGALNDSEQAGQIYNELTQLTGVQVDQSNYWQVLNDPDCWQQPSDGPAVVVPSGNLDNH